MKYTDYKTLKTGGFRSVGKFGDSIYAYEILTGISCNPEYRQISRAEFDSFENWDEETAREIMNRTVLCSAEKGRTKLNERILVDYEKNKDAE